MKKKLLTILIWIPCIGIYPAILLGKRLKFEAMVIISAFHSACFTILVTLLVLKILGII